MSCQWRWTQWDLAREEGNVLVLLTVMGLYFKTYKKGKVYLSHGEMCWTCQEENAQLSNHKKKRNYATVTERYAETVMVAMCNPLNRGSKRCAESENTKMCNTCTWGGVPSSTCQEGNVQLFRGRQICRSCQLKHLSLTQCLQSLIAVHGGHLALPSAVSQIKSVL